MEYFFYMDNEQQIKKEYDNISNGLGMYFDRYIFDCYRGMLFNDYSQGIVVGRGWVQRYGFSRKNNY